MNYHLKSNAQCLLGFSALILQKLRGFHCCCYASSLEEKLGGISKQYVGKNHASSSHSVTVICHLDLQFKIFYTPCHSQILHFLIEHCILFLPMSDEEL